MIGLAGLEPIRSSTLFLILSKVRFKSFYRHYKSVSSSVGWLRSLSSKTPYFWSIWIFFAMIERAFPSLGSGRIICNLGEVPKILLRMNFLSLIKFPFWPSMSDYRKINLPLILPWSNILSTKSMILSKASSFAPFLSLSSEKNNFGYWRWKK